MISLSSTTPTATEAEWGRYCADKARADRTQYDAEAPQPAIVTGKVDQEGLVYAGWAATGDLDFEGERIVGQAWLPPSVPVPMLLDIGTGHVGPRIGTVYTAIAEGPSLWVTFLLDGDADPDYLAAAADMLDSPDMPACMSIYAAILAAGSRVECDEDSCYSVRELRSLDLLHVMLTSNPVNVAARVIPAGMASKCEGRVMCEGCEDNRRVADTGARVAMHRTIHAARTLNAAMDLILPGATGPEAQRPTGPVRGTA